MVSLKLDMGLFKHLIDARGNKEETVSAVSSTVRLLVYILAAALVVGLVLGMFVEIPLYPLAVTAIFTNVLFSITSQITRGLGFTKDFVIVSTVVTAISFLVSITGVIFLGFN